MQSFRDKIVSLPTDIFAEHDITLRPIQDDYDLWYAVVECRLKAGQDEYVNPPRFSIGRAYLNPNDNVPCIIWHKDRRVGYIVLRRSMFDGNSTDWSYCISADEQGNGYGTQAARIAVRILSSAFPKMPIKLSVDENNIKAQKLYENLGFTKSDEIDGDEAVYVYKTGVPNEI